MGARPIILMFSMAAAALTAVGCTTVYTHSPTQASASGPGRSAAGAPGGADPHHAAPESRRRPDGSNAQGDGSPPAPGSSRRVAFTNHAPRGVDAMGLFGQVNAAASDAAPVQASDEGEDRRRITFTSEGEDFDPDVDPTGRLLVYASTRRRKTADLYLKAVDGAVLTQLTSDPANETMPTFSPDGKRIAFASDRSGDWDIYVMSVHGGAATRITSEPTQDIHPSFSPDGKRLVYCNYGSPSGRWEMNVVNLARPTVTRMIGSGLFPTWSPTGDTILFQRARQRGTRWFSIWTIDLKDHDVTPPTEVAVSSNAALITPAWRPDGKAIVFCTVVGAAADKRIRPSQADLWTVGVDGTGRTQLTRGRFANLQPVWAMDGSIYFVSDRGPDHAQNIWALPDPKAEGRTLARQ